MDGPGLRHRSERAVNNGKKIREAGKAEGKLIKQTGKQGWRDREEMDYGI